MALSIDASLLVPWAPRVLVADQDEICRAAVQTRLQTLGIAVDVAADAGEVFELCTRWSYVAVFMDWGRPAIAGHRAARAIRTRDGASQHALLVAVTAYSRPACLAAGMDHHVAKPLPADDLSRDCGALGLLAPAGPASADIWPTTARLSHHVSDATERAAGAEIARRFLRRTRRQQPKLWRAINARDRRGLSRIAGESRQLAAAAGTAAVAELFEGLLGAGGRGRFAAASAMEVELRTVLVQTAMTITQPTGLPVRLPSTEAILAA